MNETTVQMRLTGPHRKLWNVSDWKHWKGFVVGRKNVMLRLFRRHGVSICLKFPAISAVIKNRAYSDRLWSVSKVGRIAHGLKDAPLLSI